MKPELIEKIKNAFPGAEHREALDCTEFLIDKKDYLKLAEFLKSESDLAFDHCSDLIGVDYLEYLEVVCHLYSYSQRHKIRVKSRVTREDPKIGSLTSLWSTCGWLERETWDLYGIVFVGHPDLRRILSSDEEPGHPYRKDVPLENDEEWLLKDERPAEDYGLIVDKTGKLVGRI